MTIDSIIRTISLILAPAVMISSCAIFLNGIITRYESVGTRMRTMHHERLELLQELGHTTSSGALSDGFSNHRIHEIEVQLPRLLQRHKQLRNAVLAENAAIAFFVTSMFIIALAALTNLTPIATAALLIFLTGTGVLLVGVIITTLELSRSQREVTYENSRRIEVEEGGFDVGRKRLTFCLSLPLSIHIVIFEQWMNVIFNLVFLEQMQCFLRNCL